MPKKDINIFWFRQDLRLSDNPGLYNSIKNGATLPIFIFDDENSKEHINGSASKWWLHYSLIALKQSLDNNLSLYRGDPKNILIKLTETYNVKEIFWNRCYEPWRIDRDIDIKAYLDDKNIENKSFNSHLLWEPWNISKDDGTPYRVFTPYYKKGCLNAEEPRFPSKNLKIDTIFYDQDCEQIDTLDLLPRINWYSQIQEAWKPGEEGAQKRLDQFLEEGLLDYKEGRNFPFKENVSRLSPHLHFGEISPNEVWYQAKTKESVPGIQKSLEHFLSELGWREFSYYLLYHFPSLPKQNFQPKFNKFPWIKNESFLESWQKGETGYPIVDAGMRELWQTGYMHNRLRMVVGSFLVKNLLIDWREGEDWFWDCLVDADLASNSAGWQWVAGSGADAAPYFRIFNPVTQGLKFDPEGEYTKQYVPELKLLPNKFLFSPWEAPKEILEKAGIELGKDYPEPIVDLKYSRELALEAFGKTKLE